MKLQIEATSVLEQTLEAEKQFKLILHQGGSRSSKTWSIFQFFLLKALAGDRLTLTIARQKLTWVKSTLLPDFKEITEKYKIKVTPDINANRQDQVYYINGTEFAFFGLDYTEKLHGRSQDWFWLNEVMEIRKADFDQLEMRTKTGGILDYNPYDDTHWVFDLQKRPDTKVITSTMLDNPFLPKTIIDKIKSYEPTPENIEKGTADSYMWDVYGLGKKAKLQGAIFDNWDIVQDIPKEANFIGYGLDFGYTNDPTAMVGLWQMNNELYVRQFIYTNGLTNQDILQRFNVLNIDKRDSIICDSAEPKSIEELFRGGYNVKATRKGADSINYGINLLKQYKIHITEDSYDVINEFRKHKWSEDKSGRSLNKPIDDYNHAIDALRYLVIMKLGRKIDLPIFSM